MKKYPMFMDWKTWWQVSPKYYTNALQSLSKFHRSFCRSGKADLKIHMELQKTLAKTVLTKKNKVRKIILLNFKGTGINTVWYWLKDRQMIKETRNKSIHLLSIDFWQSCQDCLMGKEQSLLQMILEQLHNQSHTKEWSWTPTSHHIKI